jgi:endothelin-converting enzyme/putative endopeptidase
MFRKTLPLLLAASIATNAFAQQAVLKGIETADLDRGVQPCDNFYDFSNGAWRAQNPIPASMDRWSRRWQAAEINKDQLSTILNDISARAGATPGSPAQIAGDFYAACTNIKAIDAAGVTPLKPYLAEIDAIHDAAGLQKEISSLDAMGVMVPFVLGGAQDPHAPGAIIAWVLAGGLGLPDRDYYVKPEKRFADARSGYLVYIAKIFALSGTPVDEANKDAQTVMQFETALPKATLDNVAMRDPHAIIHTVGFDALQKMTPHFDWGSFYKSASLQPGTINVEQPEFLAEFDRQLVSTPLTDWKIYLRWQLLNSSADNLSQSFVDAHFDFYQNQLAGVGKLKPRVKRCAETSDALLGEALAGSTSGATSRLRPNSAPRSWSATSSPSYAIPSKMSAGCRPLPSSVPWRNSPASASKSATPTSGRTTHLSELRARVTLPIRLPPRAFLSPTTSPP